MYPGALFINRHYRVSDTDALQIDAGHRWHAELCLKAAVSMESTGLFVAHRKTKCKYPTFFEGLNVVCARTDSRNRPLMHEWQMVEVGEILNHPQVRNSGGIAKRRGGADQLRRVIEPGKLIGCACRLAVPKPNQIARFANQARRDIEAMRHPRVLAVGGNHHALS